MTVSRQPKITEELLSAYLDDQVTVEERTLVEEAIATDPAIAWQVDSLRQTVHLLQALPPLALPRSFSLEAILAEARAAEETLVPLQTEAVKNSVPRQSGRKTVVRAPVGEELETTWWQWFIQLCQGGNLQLRNAAAIALTLFFVLFAGDRFLVSTQRVVEMPTTSAAPVILTSSERIAVEASVVPTVEPTATTAAATIVPNAANSNDQPAGDAAAAVTANPLASTAEQTENHAFQAEGATVAAPMGAPGPREEDLTGGSGATTDAPMTEGFRMTQTDERESAAKSAASMAVVAANTVVTQEAVVAEPPLTTVVALSVSEVVTNANVVSSTAPMSLPLTVVPTSTGKSATPTTSGMPLTDEGAAWLTWLTWAQMIAALSTVVLTGLWWRSRR